MTDFVDFYKLLNVDPLISLEDLKKEMFKQKKLKSSHAASAPTPERRREAEDFLKAMDEARKFFENESTRKTYDQNLISYKMKQGVDSGKDSKKTSISQSSAPGNAGNSTILEKVKSDLNAKKYESAVADLKNILGATPGNVEARKLLITAYCEMGTQDAIDAAEKELSSLERYLNNDSKALFSYSQKIYSKKGELLLNQSQKRA